MGPYLLYIVRDPCDLEIIFKSDCCFEKHENYTKISLPLGIFTIGGDTYKLHRKTMTPAFNLKSLQSYVPIVCNQSNNFVKIVRQKFIGHEVDVFDLVAKFNLENILATLFGRNDVPQNMIETYHEDCTK